MTNFKSVSLGALILSVVCSTFGFAPAALAVEGSSTIGTLKVVKVVVGGPKIASDFNITVTGFTVVGADPINQTFAGSSEGQNVVFDFGSTVVDPIGHATVTEAPYSNYTTTYSEGCDTNIIPGDSITCTVTNTYNGYSVTVTKSGTGSGTVTGNDENMNCGEVCTSYFTEETTLTLTAVPAEGSNFNDTWTSGPCAGSNDPICTFSVNSNITANAHFSLNTTSGGGGNGGGAGGPAPSSGGSGVPSGSGSGSPSVTVPTPTPAVAGAFTSVPSVTSTPAPVEAQVLGASTTLPRTGMPFGLTLFALVLAGLLVNKKLKLV